MNQALDEIRQVKRVTLGESVHRQLRDMLMAGKLFPGEKLSLRKLAALTGLSTMPVREAVTRLVAEDALEVSPNRAICVPLMTRAKLQEITIVRHAIEGFAAAQAATNRSAGDLQAIRRLHDLFAAAVSAARPDAEKALRLNKELHFAVYAATGLPVLAGIIEGLWLKVGPVINLDLGSSHERLRSGDAVRAHAAMVAGLAAQDPDAARAGLQTDIATSSRFIQASGKLPETSED